jgi:hypothetical protein
VFGVWVCGDEFVVGESDWGIGCGEFYGEADCFGDSEFDEWSNVVFQ